MPFSDKFAQYRAECASFNECDLDHDAFDKVAASTFLRTVEELHRLPVLTAEDAEAALDFIVSELRDNANINFVEPVVGSLREYLRGRPSIVN